MPSCSRPAWSTITSSPAIATSRAPSCSGASRRRRSAASRMTDKGNTPRRSAPRAPARAWQRMLSGRRLDLLDPAPEGHRDRGHRPRPRPRRALERADGRRARLLGRPARAAGGGDRHRHAAGPHAPLAARRAAARCARIRDRRPHQPVQGRHRPRLQGLREPSCWRPSTAASACRRRCPTASPWRSRRPTASPPTSRRRSWRASPRRRPTAISACRAACRPSLRERLRGARSSADRRPPRPSSWRASRSCRSE